MKLNKNNSFLYNQTMFFEVCMSDEEKYYELTCVHGAHDDYAETRKKLLDPKTAWDLCKRPNDFCF